MVSYLSTGILHTYIPAHNVTEGLRTKTAIALVPRLRMRAYETRCAVVFPTLIQIYSNHVDISAASWALWLVAPYDTSDRPARILSLYIALYVYTACSGTCTYPLPRGAYVRVAGWVMTAGSSNWIQDTERGCFIIYAHYIANSPVKFREWQYYAYVRKSECCASLRPLE